MPPDTLLGLYQGTPLTERAWAHGNVLPDKITLYQHPIEDASDDDDDVVMAITETLIHEIGHYFGLSEEEIERIEDEFWSSDDEADERIPDGVASSWASLAISPAFALARFGGLLGFGLR